jgi:hypothetical protein
MQDCHRRRPPHGLGPGLLLILLGAGLLGREFGYIPTSVRLIDFWPLLLVSVGLSGAFRPCGLVRRLLSLSVFAFGAAVLAANLGYLTFPAARLWPVLLVMLGLGMLFRRSHRRPPFPFNSGPGGVSGDQDGYAKFRHHGERHEERISDNRLVRNISLSGAQIRVDSEAWQGGELTATFAGIELDLRNAKLDERGATLEVRATMGGIEIHVPDTWLVVCDVQPFLGGIDNDTRVPKGAPNPPRLTIIGSLAIGGLNIRS